LSALTTNWRKRTVACLILLYFVWPFVHQQLVLHYRINPWKLAGWAMYTTMKPGVRLRLAGAHEGNERATLDAHATPELAAAVARYRMRRRALGLFADPAPVARSVARAHPEQQGWVLIVDEFGLAADGWIRSVHRSEYRYRRGPAGPERVAAAFGVPRRGSQLPGK
jgi:hypothetical protein